MCRLFFHCLVAVFMSSPEESEQEWADTKDKTIDLRKYTCLFQACQRLPGWSSKQLEKCPIDRWDKNESIDINKKSVLIEKQNKAFHKKNDSISSPYYEIHLSSETLRPHYENDRLDCICQFSVSFRELKFETNVI